jgi:RNA recognition motif-containing protein
MFSVCGKIKRVKIYQDPVSKLPKGDALVAFAKPEAVALACLKVFI